MNNPGARPEARRPPIARVADHAIRLQGIAKSFPARATGLAFRNSRKLRHQVLTNVTLDVRAGEVMGLIGANGAGKTTLLEIVATTQLPTAGSGLVSGLDLLADPSDIRRLIGYAPAAPESFYSRLSGGANLEFFAALHDLTPATARERTRRVLDLIHAPELERVMFQRCSAGMKQKLTLARALLHDPAILLLDEPTRSLDAAAQSDFHHLLRQALAGPLRKTVLMVTHNAAEAEAVCDRVAWLRDGVIAGVWPADRLPEEVRAGPFAAAPERGP